MKLQHIFIVVCLFLAGVFIGVACSVRPGQQKVISDIQTNAVAYTDGTAEISIADTVPDQILHYYRAIVPALENSDYHYFLAPILNGRGGDWHRQVYTFVGRDDACEQEIFYMDRIGKRVLLSHTPYCVLGTLDEHDVTKFIAVSPDSTNLAIGNYEDGTIVATHTIPDNLMIGGVATNNSPNVNWGHAANWEITKFVFAAGDCSMGMTPSTTPKVFLWDIAKGTIEDKTPPHFDCGNYEGVEYDHDTNTFSLRMLVYGKNGGQEVLEPLH